MIIVWGSTTKYNLNLVNKLIRTSARFLLKIKKFEPVKDLLRSELNWMLVENLYQYSIVRFMYKIINKQCPDYFKNIMVCKQTLTPYNIRGGNQIYCPIVCKSNYGKRCFTVQAIQLWNCLDKSLTSVGSYEVFKRRSKLFLTYNLIDNIHFRLFT